MYTNTLYNVSKYRHCQLNKQHICHKVLEYQSYVSICITNNKKYIVVPFIVRQNFKKWNVMFLYKERNETKKISTSHGLWPLTCRCFTFYFLFNRPYGVYLIIHLDLCCVYRLHWTISILSSLSTDWCHFQSSTCWISVEISVFHKSDSSRVECDGENSSLKLILSEKQLCKD